MKETDRLADQLERSLEGEAWHGPALLELLRGVTPAEAMAKPISGVHSIGEIVPHLIVWQDVARRRLSGDPARFEIGGPQDWPPPPTATDVSWTSALDRLRASTDSLARAIRALPEARFDEPILEGFSTVYQTLHGVVQHNLYHAGQIAALKRALGRPAVEPAA